MRFLTICNQGNCRSYALARMLKYMDHEAIAIGIDFTGDVSLQELGHWADKVVVLAHRGYDIKRVQEHISKEKIIICDIGTDRWGNPFKLQLTEILYEYAQKMLDSLDITYMKGDQVKNTIFAATRYG
ncbi:hypothetical protein LCGC14_0267370 [marine sediment metagenome]|uniref:Phosphotyrosine protein phosphatase I domain-containing protein n=1 Tax=marine sediment metagenome TaxID=412755 RepID=A0A0F9WKL9_9ZZZZ